MGEYDDEFYDDEPLHVKFNSMMSAPDTVNAPLAAVNNFFNNSISYDDEKDQNHWQSPQETMERKAGDCEDYAIAKYWALREMGVPAENLRFGHVDSTRMSRPHMVLMFSSSGRFEDSLVLDNVEREIMPLRERRDLHTSYSFNELGSYKGDRHLSEVVDSRLKRVLGLVDPETQDI